VEFRLHEQEPQWQFAVSGSVYIWRIKLQNVVIAIVNFASMASQLCSKMFSCAKQDNLMQTSLRQLEENLLNRNDAAQMLYQFTHWLIHIDGKAMEEVRVRWAHMEAFEYMTILTKQCNWQMLLMIRVMEEEATRFTHEALIFRFNFLLRIQKKKWIIKMRHFFVSK
jgi:hypothetical protein